MIRYCVKLVAVLAVTVLVPGLTFTQDNPLAKEGLERLKDKQYAKAIELLTQALKQNPAADLFVNRARAYREIKEYAKAIDDCTSAIAINGKSAAAFNLRGAIYEDQQKLEDALSDYTRAVEVSSTFALAYRNRGRVYYDKGNFAKAAADFEKALALKLSDEWRPDTELYLAMACIKLGRFDAAIEACTRAIAQDPKLFTAYSNRGAAYYKKGDLLAAIKSCDEAIRLNPESPHAYRWRSQAFAKLGKNDRARADYLKAVSIDPAQHLRFEYTAFLPGRQEALLALEAYRLGSTLTPSKLQQVNDLPGGEPIEGSESAMSGGSKELLASERKHYSAVEFEMVAAADAFLRAATMTPAQRKAKGLKVGWLFGPVSAPNARGGSKDGLAGLRIIGRLELPKGKVINSIFAVRFYPSEKADEEGKVGLLSNVDNFRLEVRLFNEGTTKTDYAFHSFSVAGQGSKMTMKPGFYLNKTGGLVSRELDSAALGTSCINCHLNGPRVVKEGSENLKLMSREEYPAMEGFRDFLEQIRHWSGGLNFRRKLEDRMKIEGPRVLLPLEEMLKANREHWISIYPRYIERMQNPSEPALVANFNPIRDWTTDAGSVNVSR